MSLGSERKAVRTMNEQLTISILTDLRSTCLQLAQHRPKDAYGLTIFVGSGLTQLLGNPAARRGRTPFGITNFRFQIVNLRFEIPSVARTRWPTRQRPIDRDRKGSARGMTDYVTCQATNELTNN